MRERERKRKRERETVKKKKEQKRIFKLSNKRNKSWDVGSIVK